MNGMKAIFEYGDFRSYLRDFHDSPHSRCSKFSWRAISKRAKINNPNFLRQVMLGEKNLGERNIGAVGKAIGFLGAELEYWTKLVHFCQAPDGDQKERYRLELLQMRGSVRSREISEGFDEYYSRWYIPAIRELVTLFDFKDDYALLARSLTPSICEDEARLAVRLLAKHHFIRRNSKGLWEETDRALRSGSPRQRASLVRYHREMLSKASQSITKWKKNSRFIAGMTVGVSKTCYRMILTETKKFKTRIETLVHNDSQSDTVMQIALQIFPVAATPKSEIIAEKEKEK